MVKKLPKLFGFIMLAMLIVFGIAQPSYAQQKATKEYQVKAAILYRVVKYIKWPHNFEGRQQFNFCFTGEDNFHNALDQLKTQKAKGLRINLKKNVKTEDIVNCDVAFVGHTSKENIQKIRELVKDKPILLAGEDEDFAKDGGAIRLFKYEGKIKFNVNIPAFDKSKLTISSDMLKSAKKIFRRKKTDDQ